MLLTLTVFIIKNWHFITVFCVIFLLGRPILSNKYEVTSRSRGTPWSLLTSSLCGTRVGSYTVTDFCCFVCVHYSTTAVNYQLMLTAPLVHLIYFTMWPNISTPTTPVEVVQLHFIIIYFAENTNTTSDLSYLNSITVIAGTTRLKSNTNIRPLNFENESKTQNTE